MKRLLSITALAFSIMLFASFKNAANAQARTDISINYQTFYDELILMDAGSITRIMDMSGYRMPVPISVPTVPMVIGYGLMIMNGCGCPIMNGDGLHSTMVAG